jgi:hypothetical protein
MPEKAPRTPSELSVLRKEVAALKKELAKVQKTLAKLREPGKLRATKLTVDHVEIVDAAGQVLASIDAEGTLLCRKLLVANGKKERGVLIEGGEARRIQAGRVELIGATAKQPAVELDGANAGQLLLANPGSKQRLCLQASGSPVLASNDLTGEVTVNIASNGDTGGRVQFAGVKAATGASVILGISPHTQAGALVILEKGGAVTGKLP